MCTKQVHLCCCMGGTGESTLHMMSLRLLLLCRVAAKAGHLSVLRWLRCQNPPCPWGPWVCTSAVYRNHLNVLQWLRSRDLPCPWDEWTCLAAAAEGHLELLQWLRAQEPPCPWGEHRLVDDCF